MSDGKKYKEKNNEVKGIGAARRGGERTIQNCFFFQEGITDVM